MDSKPRIIVADDDSGDRYLISLALEEAGIGVEIEEYEDGAALIDFLTNRCVEPYPKFILLDLNMPKKTGLEVLEFMRSHPLLCRVPVIILSTSSDPHDISRSKELGATDYIVKPPDYTGYVDIAKKLGEHL